MAASPITSTFRIATKLGPGDVLSPSQVSNVMDCAHRWYAKHVLGLPDPPAGNLSLGRAVHAALAANFTQKGETKADLPVPGVVAVFREAWTLAREYTEFRNDENPSELGRTGEALVAKYMDEAARALIPFQLRPTFAA